MSEPVVLYEVRPPAALLTLNRPASRNAISRALIRALADAFRRAQDDPAVRSVIVTGAGSVFCAGMDLAELSETLGQDENQTVWDDAQQLASLFDKE